MKTKPLLAVSLLAFALFAQVLISPSPVFALDPLADFSILVENVPDGRIFIWKDDEAFELGHVKVPVGAVNDNGFTASMWGKDGTVCATAVNAIHIKVRNNPETGRGVIFSILPKEFLDVDPGEYKSYLSKNTSLFTDIPAGTGIFGGGFAPVVGSSVEIAEILNHRVQEILEREAQETGFLRSPVGMAISSPIPIQKDYKPKEGQVIVIRVRHYPPPIYLEFENKFGGLIKIKYAGKEPQPIGQVLKPVAGVGRFEGTSYARVGRIRANHPGVIDISTSPIAEIGGFQIIPREHAMSPEMTLARTLTQWMVVGPLSALDAPWEGTPPLFSGYIFPSYIPLLSNAPEHADISALNRLLSRFHVLAKMRGKDEWGPLPTLTGRDDTALVDLEAIRIYFPLPVRETNSQ